MKSAPVRWHGFDGIGVLMAFIGFVVIAAAMNIGFATALLLSLATHEAGRVLAYRQLGLGQTNVRFLPLVTGVQISENQPRNDTELAYASLMGAGLSLGPMALSMSLWALTKDVAGPLSGYFLVLGTTIGALNFVLLLPFWRLPGRFCADVAARAFWPALSPGLAAFFGAALLVGGLRNASIALVLLGAYGLTSIFRKRAAHSKPMSTDDALTALAAYVFTFAAHFSAAALLAQALF